MKSSFTASGTSSVFSCFIFSRCVFSRFVRGVWAVVLAVTFSGCHNGTWHGASSEGHLSESAGEGSQRLRYQVKKEGHITNVDLILPNGLEVLLISNPTLKKAAGAMAVPVGSWSDPDEHLGLAHYLEHMLFLGTEKYPQAKDYQAFISAHSGSSNAFTDSAQTNFHFEVNTSAYEESLDRFAQFFIAPLFNPESSGKEKEAVNNEYLGDIQKEAWRIHEVFNLTSGTSHPKKRFSIGTTETLKNVTPEILREFYEKHYSADTMKLVLMAPVNIETMITLAEQNFSSVPNRHLKGAAVLPPLPADQGGQWLEIRSLTNVRMVQLAFPIPLALKDWKSKSAQTVASVLGDQGEGGLEFNLKKNGWIANLQMEVESRAFDLDGNDYLNLNLNLTRDGEQNLNKVIAEAFRYIGEVKSVGLKAYTVDEVKTIGEINLRYRDQQVGMDGASTLAGLMLAFPGLEAEVRATLVFDRDEESEKKVLEALTPENVRVVVVGPGIRGKKTEEYFQVPYNVRRLSPAWINKMRAAMEEKGSGIYFYPRPIKEMPKDFGLVSAGQSEWPLALHADSETAAKIWVLPETSEISSPKSFAKVQLISPKASQSAVGSVLSRIWARAILFGRSAEFSDSTKVGFSVGVVDTAYGAELTFSGYSASFQQRLAQVLKNPASPMNEAGVSAKTFKQLKEDYGDELQGAAFEFPTTQMSKAASQLIDPRHFGREELITALETVSYEDYVKYSQNLMKKVALRIFVYGNEKPENWRDFANEILKFYHSEALTSEEIEKALGIENTPLIGKHFAYAITSENNNHGVIESIFTGPKTPKNMAMMKVLSGLIDEPFYSEMRTNQQLGYVAGTFNRDTQSQVRLLAVLQSGGYKSGELSRRMDKYLVDFSKELQVHLGEVLESTKAEVTESLLDRGSTMVNRFDYWLELFINYDARWELARDLVHEVRELKADEFSDFIQRAFDPKNSARLTIYHYGKGATPPAPLEGEVMVKNRQEYLELNRPRD